MQLFKKKSHSADQALQHFFDAGRLNSVMLLLNVSVLNNHGCPGCGHGADTRDLYGRTGQNQARGSQATQHQGWFILVKDLS